MMISKQSNY